MVFIEWSTRFQSGFSYFKEDQIGLKHNHKGFGHFKGDGVDFKEDRSVIK